MNLSERLQELLTLTGIKQSDLAREASELEGKKVTNQNIYQILAQNQTSSKFAHSLAKVFKVNALWLSAKGKTDEPINAELGLLGRNIRASREAMGLSLSEFAKQIIDMAYNNLESADMLELGFEFDDRNGISINQKQNEENIKLIKKIEMGQCMLLLVHNIEETFVSILCAVVQTTPETLRHARIETEVAVSDDMLSIPNLSATASMGTGISREFDHDQVLSKISLKMDYIREYMPDITSPENLRVITGLGDSMLGTFNHLDQIFIDVGINIADVDGVYVFTLENQLYIKRLQRVPCGGYLMISDNSMYKPINLTPKDCETLEVLGKARVVWGAKKL